MFKHRNTGEMAETKQVVRSGGDIVRISDFCQPFVSFEDVHSHKRETEKADFCKFIKV